MSNLDYINQIQDIIQNFTTQQRNPVVVVWGATATGKSAVSVEMAKHFPLEVVSSDSRQVFRYMDIWTDKVSSEIRQKIPHHMIDVVDPDQQFTAWQRKQAVVPIVDDIHAKWSIPFVVGGTWLYIDTIYKNFSMPRVDPDFGLRSELMKKEEEQQGFLHNYLKQVDPVEAERIHPNSLRFLLRALEIFIKTGKPKSSLAVELPVQWPILMIWLWRQAEESNKRIKNRIYEMVEKWLIEEIRHLLKMWYSPDLQSMQWIGYKEIVPYILGQITIDKALEQLIQNTQYYAKRQRTWFRRYINDQNNNPKKWVHYELLTLD